MKAILKNGSIFLDGVKCYPVGSWEGNQHKFYNYHDVCYLKMVEDEYSDEAYKAFEEADRLLELFDRLPQYKGIVYATWEDYKRLKAVIQWYG